MRYVSLFVLLFVTSNVMAQIIEDKEPAILEVHYMKTSVADTLKKQSDSDPMTLRVGKTSAMFYPPKGMWVDSLLQTNFELHEKLYREMNPPGQSEYKPLGGLGCPNHCRRSLLVHGTHGNARLANSVGNERTLGV